MNFGLLSLSSTASLLTTDEFNPYYYKGWKGWTSGTLHQSNSLSAGSGNYEIWSRAGVVYHRGGGWSLTGSYIFSRFADTDLIFVEPLSSMVGMTINSLESVNGGAHWRIGFNVRCDAALYDWYDLLCGPVTIAQKWYDPNPGWNVTCPLLPKVHVFSQLSAGGVLSDRYGIAIYDNQNRCKFNSSQNPLMLKDIISVNYPTPTQNVMMRQPTEKLHTPHAYCSRPMYCISNVSQAVTQFQWADSVKNSNWTGASSTATWDFRIWGVYGGSLVSGNTSSVGAGWAVQGWGYQGSSSTSSSTIFGIPTGSTSNTAGGPPYTQLNCNSDNVQCLVADAADYV